MRFISFALVSLVIVCSLTAFAQSPIEPPADVKAPPAGAKKTASGLAFDSSVTRGIGLSQGGIAWEIESCYPTPYEQLQQSQD